MSSRVLIPILLILLPICLPSAQYYPAVEYPISPGFYFAEVNGVKIYDPSQAVYVKPGDIIEGFFDVRVVNVRGGPWITPVIGTASWTRGDFSCITNDAPDGESIQSYHFHLKAPETPGTYYIGIFAGWMYSCEEVASNDHPPQFNDGDDVWDMSRSDWESIISTGKASKYGQPGRAIRIVVSGAPSIQVDVWTDKGGKGVGNLDGGRYRIGESAVFYCSINGDASYLKVWIEKPNGSIVTLFENFNVKAGTYEFKGVMGEPEGERRLKAVACPAGQSCKSEDMLSRDEVRYYVEGGAKLEISHNFPSEVYQGQEFSVSVTVRNSGNIEVRNVASGIWWADDAFKGMGCTGTDKRDSLKPGEYMQYSCKLKAIGSPGTYDVEISAVADGGISASSKFKVRISQVQDKEPPKVRVIFPNGGETLYIGEAYKITWEATDNVKVEKVHIWLFQGDRQVSTIVTDNPNTGYFVWIPNMEGKFRIRVAAIDPSGNSAYDDSDSDFNVVPKGAENKPPTAYIDSISPNPAYEGQTIYFSGHGYDPDGSIAECEWKADERFLSSSCSFSTSLPPGKYTIYFRVKDDKGAWSSWASGTLEVKTLQLTASLSTDRDAYEKPYEVTFRVDIMKALPGHYNGKILIIDPSSETVGVIEFPIDLEGSEGHIIKKWRASEDSKPGTYSAVLFLEGEHGRTAHATGFYLEDPDKSYVEVLPSREGIKIIHIHLQRFALGYPEELPPIDSIMAMKSFKVDSAGVGLEALAGAISAIKAINIPSEIPGMVIKGIMFPKDTYDLTIIPVHKAGQGYFVLLFESHPIGAPGDTIRNFIIDTAIEYLLKKLVGISIPSVPIPIEYFGHISEEDYEAFTAKGYTFLTLPIQVRLEYLEKPKQEYKLGEPITAKVQVIDPRTNEPMKGDIDIVACIAPSTYNATPMCVKAKNGILDNLYTDQVYNTFHLPEYVLYFVASAPGYLGISRGEIIRISGEKTLLDISKISFGINPNSISFSESAKIYLSFDVSAQVPYPCQVEVRILKKTFFGLFTTEITKKYAEIGHNDLVISLKGEEIVDKILFWPISGDYNIYAEIMVFCTTPKSTVPVSSYAKTPVLTINVHP